MTSPNLTPVCSSARLPRSDAARSTDGDDYVIKIWLDVHCNDAFFPERLHKSNPTSTATVASVRRQEASNWDWYLEAKHTLKTAGRLKRGWNSYHAEPPSQSALAYSHEFLNGLHDTHCPPAGVRPSAVGGVGFTFLGAGKEVYVEILNSGKCFAAIMSDDKPPDDLQSIEVTCTTDGFAELIETIRATINA